MALVKVYILQKEHWDKSELGAYKEAQKLLQTLRKAGHVPTRKMLTIAKDPTNWEYWENLEDAAYEMGVEAKWIQNRWVLRMWKPGMKAGTGKIIPIKN